MVASTLNRTTRVLVSANLSTAFAAAFSIGALLAGTLGPVYWFRIRIEPFDGPWISDPIVLSIFGTIYVVAAVLTRQRKQRLDYRPLVVLIALHLMLVASTLWSSDRSLTLTQSLLALMTIALPWYLVNRWDRDQLVTLAWAATTIGVLGSAVAVQRGWADSIDATGNWAGIYFNRNSLGPVAGASILLGTWIVVSLREFAPLRTVIVVRIAAGVSLPLAGLLLLKSGSKTSLAATAIAVCALIVFELVARFGPSWFGRRHYLGALAIGAVGFLAAFPILRSWTGSDTTLQGRTTLWSHLLDQIQARPLTGNGWLATYTTTDYWHWSVDNLSRNVQSAHNGVLEVAVGAGLIAFVLVIIVLWFGIDRSVQAASQTDQRSVAPLAIAIFFLISNSGETFIGAHHFLWVLFLAVCALPWKPAKLLSDVYTEQPVD